MVRRKIFGDRREEGVATPKTALPFYDPAVFNHCHGSIVHGRPYQSEIAENCAHGIDVQVSCRHFLCAAQERLLPVFGLDNAAALFPSSERFSPKDGPE
jgi:hypothetical protein